MSFIQTKKWNIIMAILSCVLITAAILQLLEANENGDGFKMFMSINLIFGGSIRLIQCGIFSKKYSKADR